MEALRWRRAGPVITGTGTGGMFSSVRRRRIEKARSTSSATNNNNNANSDADNANANGNDTALLVPSSAGVGAGVNTRTGQVVTATTPTNSSSARMAAEHAPVRPLSTPPPASQGMSSSELTVSPDEVTVSEVSTGRGGALRRVKMMFERPDARVEENLRSLKRRIIQVRRQHDATPVRCTLGFRSRTGWEPIRALRENQDCLVALLPWGPNAQFALFAALDGHGRAGHHASMFIAQRVVSYLGRTLATPTVDVAYALHRAIEYAEQRLQSSAAKIDCQMSGTTGVFVLLHGAMLYCANVGDSRAVLGRALGPGAIYDSRRDHKSPVPAIGAGVGTIPTTATVQLQPPSAAATQVPDDSIMSPCGYRPVQLSFDQKPSRADEKQRLQAAGARVDAWEGVDVGDERVWLPESRTPGLAVTRSFGDFILKDYGVNATPEIYQLPLHEDDRFLVVASDGVFEFLQNYEVISIASRFRDSGTPQAAAEEIVKLAAERWIEDDSVIDDISCLVVFIDVHRAASDFPAEPVLVETDISNVVHHQSHTAASPPPSSVRAYISGPNMSHSSAHVQLGAFGPAAARHAHTDFLSLTPNSSALSPPQTRADLHHQSSASAAELRAPKLASPRYKLPPPPPPPPQQKTSASPCGSASTSADAAIARDAKARLQFAKWQGAAAKHELVDMLGTATPGSREILALRTTHAIREREDLDDDPARFEDAEEDDDLTEPGAERFVEPLRRGGGIVNNGLGLGSLRSLSERHAAADSSSSAADLTNMNTFSEGTSTPTASSRYRRKHSSKLKRAMRTGSDLAPYQIYAEDDASAHSVAGASSRLRWLRGRAENALSLDRTSLVHR